MLLEILKNYGNLYLENDKKHYDKIWIAGLVASMSLIFCVVSGCCFIVTFLAEILKYLKYGRKLSEFGNISSVNILSNHIFWIFVLTFILYMAGVGVVSVEKNKLNTSLIYILRKYIPCKFMRMSVQEIKGIEAERVKLYEIIAFMMEIFENNKICLNTNYLHIIIEEMSREIDSGTKKLNDNRVSELGRMVKDWLIPVLGVVVSIIALVEGNERWIALIAAVMIAVFVLMIYLIERVPQKIIYETNADEKDKIEKTRLLRDELILLEEQINNGFDILPEEEAKKVAMEIIREEINLDEIRPCFFGNCEKKNVE